MRDFIGIPLAVGAGDEGEINKSIGKLAAGKILN
jgi:hypothetical protein